MSADAPDAETDYSPRERLILGTATLVTALYAMTVTITNVALPRIQGALSATIDALIILNIVATAVATVSGWLAARFPALDVAVAIACSPSPPCCVGWHQSRGLFDPVACCKEVLRPGARQPSYC